MPLRQRSLAAREGDSRGDRLADGVSSGEADVAAAATSPPPEGVTRVSSGSVTCWCAAAAVASSTLSSPSAAAAGVWSSAAASAAAAAAATTGALLAFSSGVGARLAMLWLMASVTASAVLASSAAAAGSAAGHTQTNKQTRKKQHGQEDTTASLKCVDWSNPSHSHAAHHLPSLHHHAINYSQLHKNTHSRTQARALTCCCQGANRA